MHCLPRPANIPLPSLALAPSTMICLTSSIALLHPALMYCLGPCGVTIPNSTALARPDRGASPQDCASPGMGYSPEAAAKCMVKSEQQPAACHSSDHPPSRWTLQRSDIRPGAVWLWRLCGHFIPFLLPHRSASGCATTSIAWAGSTACRPSTFCRAPSPPHRQPLIRMVVRIACAHRLM